MTDDFRIDARRWRFLDDPARYLAGRETDLRLEPLARQFRTAKDILTRLADGRGVLLADDVGLGKTTIGALVAWVVACQDKRVRIYAPNQMLRRRWAEELARHVPLLEWLGARPDRIKVGKVEKLRAGRIQIATHRALVESHGRTEERTACDLMIIDEAHRAKGEESQFNEALRALGDRAKRKLILTATPFSIRLSELEEMLQFAGATSLDGVRRYAHDLKRLYSLGPGHDAPAEAKRLVSAARAAIDELRPHLIRHGIEDLPRKERAHFGEVEERPWEIPSSPATDDDLMLLLRMDRILQLAPERTGERRNDPRFHVGWEHVARELARASERATDDAACRHIEAARKAVRVRAAKPHPKVAAVVDAIRETLADDEKVVVFCHHRATASELLRALERELRPRRMTSSGPPESVWREVWESRLPNKDPLVQPIIDWLCTPGIRRQIVAWLDEPPSTGGALVEALETCRPRRATRGVPTILGAAQALVGSLLDGQSGSTRSVLQRIATGRRTFGKASHFPGRLDEGLRTVGTWHDDAEHPPSKTLYTAAPDIVLAIFNSPFGPDVLVATDMLSEGIDLHRYCRHLIHYELDPSPVRTLQRNGRVRRVGSWAALTGKPIRYAHPTFGGTRDEKAVAIMKQRIAAFGLLLGGVPPVNDDANDPQQDFASDVLRRAQQELQRLNRGLTV